MTQRVSTLAKSLPSERPKFDDRVFFKLAQAITLKDKHGVERRLRAGCKIRYMAGHPSVRITYGSWAFLVPMADTTKILVWRDPTDREMTIEDHGFVEGCYETRGFCTVVDINGQNHEIAPGMNVVVHCSDLTKFQVTINGGAKFCLPFDSGAKILAKLVQEAA